MIEQLEEEHRKLDEEIKRCEKEYSSWYYLGTHVTELKNGGLAKIVRKDVVDVGSVETFHLYICHEAKGSGIDTHRNPYPQNLAVDRLTVW